LVRFKRAACNCTANEDVWSTGSLWSCSPLLLGLSRLPGIGGGCGGPGPGFNIMPGGGGGGTGAGGADDVRWWPDEGNWGGVGGIVGKPFVVLVTKIKPFNNYYLE
jgi:hypothetical protein